MAYSISKRSGFLLLAGLLISVSACATPSRKIAPPAPAASEEFDPQSLDDDFVLKPPAGAETPAANRSEVTAPVTVQVDGFRVQIAVVSNLDRAEKVKNEAAARLGAQVYVYRDPDTGLHKIQVGNGRTAEEAEPLRQLAKNQGYREAFIVRTGIEVSRAEIYGPDPVDGYRVQIFAASNHAAAEAEKANVRDTLGRDDVYIESEPPYFKVRIGNFQTREAAEGLMERLKAYGYDTTFVVRTRIATITKETTGN